MTRRRISVVKADITRLEVDAVVNAANELLAVGGGVDAAIHEAAGERELAAACAALGGCEPGDAKATPGFALPARWIIHAVGPVWRGGDDNEDEVLASVYRRALGVADELEARSIAFPAISTGAFGFPSRLAAQIAVHAVSTAETAVERIIFTAFDDETLSIYTELLEAS